MTDRQPTPLHRPVTEADVERALLSNIEALLAGDLDQAASRSRFFARHRLMAATGLARLLIEDRLPAAGAGFHMIEALTFGYPDDILRQIALNPHAPDVTRFGAHRRLGWSIAETAEEEARLRLEFLSTMDDPASMLTSTAAAVLPEWPGGLEIVDEIVRYLAIMPPDEREAIVRQIVAEANGNAVWLLHAMLPIEDDALQVLSLRELARRRMPTSSGPVARLAFLARNDEVRREAEATAQRLRLRAVDSATDTIPWHLPPTLDVRSTAVGLDGLQRIVITWTATQAPRLVVEFEVGDAGVADAFGRLLIMPLLDEDEDDDEYFDDDDDDLIDDEEVEEVLALPEFVDLGALRPIAGGFYDGNFAPVTLAVARGAVAAALERQTASGRPLPPTFELWEPFLHEELPPPADEPLAPATLSDDAVEAQKISAAACAALLRHPAYQEWDLDREAMLQAMADVPPPTSARWSLKQFQPLTARLFAVDDIQRIRRGLQRQAALLEHTGDAVNAQRALQAAASLRETRWEDLPKHPLIREILKRSAGAALRFML